MADPPPSGYPSPPEDAEWVLRRVHKSVYKTTDPITVERGGFCPAPDDSDGLSVPLSTSTTPAELAAAGRAGAEAYCVCKLRVGDIRALGVNVWRDDHLPDKPDGHCVIPELTFDGYQAAKKQWRETTLELAKLAMLRVVYQPDPSAPPTSAAPIRPR